MTIWIFDETIYSSVSRAQCQRLAELAAGKVVLELGSWTGRSTVALASTAKRLHAVDWHRGDPHAGQGDTLGTLVQNLRKHGLEDRVVLHVGRNVEVLPFFKDGLFGLIFIDSFHSEPAVQADVELCRRLLAPGGMLAFHDYGLAHVSNGIQFGVTEVVDRLVREDGWRIETVESMAILFR